ncbi:MAG TPA: RidA family protein [Chloroflexota bacterium]|nr:RidA family protein [Chloroflexota bacterium]
MERQSINPWTWQDQFGFVQATELRDPRRWLVCAGQAAVDETGRPLHPGDVRAQLRQALDNLETVLRQGGFTLADVVRLTLYTADVEGCLAAWDELSGRLGQANCRSAMTLLGVARLAFPELLVEIEATAAA